MLNRICSKGTMDCLRECFGHYSALRHFTSATLSAALRSVRRFAQCKYSPRESFWQYSIFNIRYSIFSILQGSPSDNIHTSLILRNPLFDVRCKMFDLRYCSTSHIKNRISDIGHQNPRSGGASACESELCHKQAEMAQLRLPTELNPGKITRDCNQAPNRNQVLFASCSIQTDLENWQNHGLIKSQPTFQKRDQFPH